MAEFVITIDADKAPEILLGQSLFGGKVTALNLGKRELVSAAELAEKYGLSRPTIINKLAMINRGTTGKHLYDPEQADVLLKSVKHGAGRKRNQ